MKDNLHFALFTVLVLYGISTIFMFSFMPIPEQKTPVGQPIIQKDPFVIDFNDEHISAIEQVLFIVPGFFGTLRLYDALGLMGIVPTKLLKRLKIKKGRGKERKK